MRIQLHLLAPGDAVAYMDDNGHVSDHDTGFVVLDEATPMVAWDSDHQLDPVCLETGALGGSLDGSFAVPRASA